MSIKSRTALVAGLAGQVQSSGGSTSIAVEDAPSGEDVSSTFLRYPKTAKVLMVDDDKLNSFVVAEYLKADGFRDLVYTTDPFSALRMAYQERPDVILLDLQMPKLGGLEILRQLRADDVFDRIAVVILTASKDDKARAQALKLGATDVLHKSLGRNELLARLRKVLAEQACRDQVRLI